MFLVSKFSFEKRCKVIVVSRIPADESAAFTSWDIPEVKDGQIVKVEKLKERGPRGELINVSKDEIIYNSLTAAQLEEISSQAYDEVQSQAHKEGLKLGHAEGYQAGLDAAQKTIKKQADTISNTIAELFEYLGGQDDEVEQALVNVTIGIASAVLRRELTIDSSQIQQIVTETLAMLPMNASNITINVSEHDHRLLTEKTDIPSHWQLQIDRTITSGGCRVSSEQSVVDYTLESQFQQTVNALVESRFSELAANAKQRIAGSDPSGKPSGGQG
jgi:flagellar assembly protein FliH